MEEREYQRLKELIDSGRKFHYMNLVFAGLIITLLFKNVNENLKLFLEIEFPIRNLLIFIYFLTVIYTIVCFDIFSSIWKRVNNEFNEEIPFNWFVLTGNKTRILSIFWIGLPWLISAIGIGFSHLDIDKASIIALGLFSIAIIFDLKKFAYKIANKSDENGNKVTFSIYLLYWYRLLREIFVVVILCISIYTAFNTSLININPLSIELKITIGVMILLFILRLLGTFKFFYQRIDKFGEKFGFGSEYKIL
jgi:hypothetical protein